MSKYKSPVKYYLNMPFILCVIVLSTAVIGMPKIIENLGVYFLKLPLDMQKSLDDLNEEILAPYKVIQKTKITNHAIEEALGTKEYIQWELENTEESKNSPTRHCSLFITYYTGIPDQVPHVPEECYTGGGAQRLGTSDIIIKNILVDGNSVEIPVRSLTFGNTKGNFWSNKQPFNVLYFFKVNGRYAGNRASARGFMQANLFSKYSYFSKVEWKFYNYSAMGIKYPDPEQAAKASEQLLSIIVPELEKNHWPDWEKANEQAKE